MHPKGLVPDDGQVAGRSANGETRPGATSSEEEDDEEQEDGSSGEEETDESDGSGSEESGEEGESDGEGSQSGSGEEGSDEEMESGEASGSSEDDEEDEGEEGDEVVVKKPAKRRADAFVDSDSSDGQADRCPICLSRFLGQDLGSPESCEHMFCLDCIMEWSQNMNTCPVDRHIFKMVFMRKTPDGKILKKLPAHAQNAVAEDDEDATPCEICGRSDREDRLLLCDGCDQGFHMDCLNPPLANVPVEEWFCRECDAQNHHDEEAESEPEAVPNVEADRPLIRRGPQRRVAHVGGTRLLPRTRQSELVRRRIQLTRATRMRAGGNNDDDDDHAGPSTSGVRAPTNGQVVRRPRRTPVKRKRKTVRRKTPKRRRKTTKRKSSTPSSASKKTGTTKRRKTRRRKKTKSQKKTVRKTKKITVPSGRSRLAEQLGVKKKLPQHFLPEMKEPSTSKWNRGRQPEAAMGAAPLQLFGQRDDLYVFADSHEDEGGDVATVSGVPAHLISARPRKVLSASAILSRRPVGLSGLSARVARRLHPAAAAATPSTSFDVLGDILNCQALLQKSSKEVVIQRDGSLRVPVPAATLIAKGAVGAANQCPMEPSRTSQSAVGVPGSSQSGVIATKDGGSSSRGGGHPADSGRSGGRGQGGAAGGSDGRSGSHNDGSGDHHHGGNSHSGSGNLDPTRKPGKRSDEKENKKAAVETDDDIDIYSDIETGSLDNDADETEAGGADRSVDMDDLEMAIGGDSPVSVDRHHHQRGRHASVEPAAMDDSRDDAGQQSDVSSEDDLVIDESVKPVEEDDDEDDSNNDDGGTYKRSSRFGAVVPPNAAGGGDAHGSDADSEENDLVIDELDNDHEASNDSVPPVGDGSSAAVHDSPSGIEEVSSAEEEDDEENGPTSPRTTSQADVSATNQDSQEQIDDVDDSKSGSEDGMVDETKTAEDDAESGSEEEEVGMGRTAEQASNNNSEEEDCDEDKIVEEYNRNAAKNKEHSRDLVKAVVAEAAGGEEAVSSAEEEEEEGNESDLEMDGEGANPSGEPEPAPDTGNGGEEDEVDPATVDGDEEETEEPHQQSGDEAEASVDGEDLGEDATVDSEEELEESGEVDPTDEAIDDEMEQNEEEDLAVDEDGEGISNLDETAEDNPEDETNNDPDNYPSDDHEPLNDSEHTAGLSDDYHHEDAAEQDLNDELMEQSGEMEETSNQDHEVLADSNSDGRRDRSHRHRPRDSASGLLSRRRGSPQRASGRRGGGRGTRDYEEGEIVEDSPPHNRRNKTRKSRPDSPPPDGGFENYEKDMPRVNMSDLPRIPKIRRDGGGNGNTQQDADGNYDSGFDPHPPSDAVGLDEDGDALERERASVLARLEEDRVAADISWKKLSQNSRTRNYRDNKAKVEQIRHVRGGERKTAGLVTMASGGVIDPSSTRKWIAGGATAPPEPPPDRERDRERDRVRDREKEKKARSERDRATEHGEKERARTSKESRDARLKESRDVRLKESKEARLKERAHDRTRSGSKHEKERYKEKDKHKVDRHKSDKVHRDWKDKEKTKRGSLRSAEPVVERSRERGRDLSSSGRYEKRDKVAPPPPPPISSDRKEKRDRKTREKLRGGVPVERDHRDVKHREHRKQREREKVVVPAVPPTVVAPCSREPSPIESKEVYASGDSIIVNVNFSRPATGTKGGADIIEVPQDDVIITGTRAFKIKERERERDPIKKLEIELRERKRQRLSEMEAHRKERVGRGERTKKRVAAEPERARREVGGKRSRMDPSRLGPPCREVLVKGSSAPAASNRWNPFTEEGDESMGSERKSGGSASPIMIRDDDGEDEDARDVDERHHHHHQTPLHSFEDNSDDDVVEILPSPEDDASKGGGYQSDEPHTPADEDLGGEEGESGGVSGDFQPYDSPPNEPRPPCSPPSPAEDNDSVYDPFEPTKSPSPLSSPEPPTPTQQQLPAATSVGKPDPPPLPPDMQQPMPPPEPPEQDAAHLTSELPLTTQAAPTPTVVTITATPTPLPSVVAPVVAAQVTPPVAIVTPVATPTSAVAASPVRGLLPPMAMPNIRVPPPNYIPRSVAPGTSATSPSVRAPHIQMVNQQPRPLNWPVVNAPAGMLFAAAQQQQLIRPGGAAFMRPPPPHGARPMSLSQIGSLLHSQIASMQQGLRAPQQVSASGLRLQVPLGLPAALLQQSFGSLQQLAQSLSASMPVGVATISQNGELKRGATGHGHQDVTTEVVDMDVDSPYSPGDTVDPDGGPSTHHEHVQRGSSRGGGDRFDTLAGSRKENVPSRGEKSAHGSSGSKSRSHGAAGSRGSRRKGAESHSSRKHIVRFEVPERQQAKAARSGGKEGGGKKGEDGKKEVAVKMDETQLKILDELPSSAVEMQVKEKFLKKLNRQERVIEEVKLAIKPFYNRREITKEEYKEILRKSVPKICHNKAGDINPVKIKALVDGYIRKFKYNRKKETKGTTSKKS